MIKNLEFTALLSNIGSVISSSIINIILIIIFIILGYALLKNNNKYSKYKKYIIGIPLIIIVFILIYYNKGLFKTLDYLSNNIFMIFYFPNLFYYIVGLILLNIIVWKVFFNEFNTRKLKIISIIVYLMISYFSILLVGIISNSKLNVFSLDDIYKNTKALSLIRISSIIFVIYLIFLILYKIYYKYLNRNNITIPKYDSVIDNKNYNLSSKKIPSNIKEVDYPKYVKKEEKSYIIDNNNNNNNQEELKEFEKMLTLDDYKLIVKLLLDHKLKEKLSEQITFKNIDIDEIKVSGVRELLEKVEPVRDINMPTIEQVMPIYKKEQEEVIAQTIETIDENAYKARKINESSLITEEVVETPLKKEKIEQLLRLYQE